MKVLVLGSHGQLGRCLYDQINNYEYKTVFTSRLEIDITDLSCLRKKIIKINPDIIINAAAYTQVDQAEKCFDKANLINNIAVSKLAEICSESNYWLIHISTDYVFDGEATIPYIETDLTNPKCVYGSSKLNGEKALISSGCKYIIVRTSWVFSEYGTNFMKTMLDLGKKYSKISVVGDQFGCPTYAQDIAKAILHITQQIEIDNLESSIYHYAGHSICSWYEFCLFIFSEAKKIGYSIPNEVVKISTSEYPTAAFRPKYSALNTNKFQKKFAFKSSDWQKAVKDVLKALND